jgi:hypothetical protein
VRLTLGVIRAGTAVKVVTTRTELEGGLRRKAAGWLDRLDQ